MIENTRCILPDTDTSKLVYHGQEINFYGKNFVNFICCDIIHQYFLQDGHRLKGIYIRNFSGPCFSVFELTMTTNKIGDNMTYMKIKEACKCHDVRNGLFTNIFYF